MTGSRLLNFSAATLTPADALTKLQWQDFTRKAIPSAIEEVAVADPQEPVTARSIRLAMIAERPAYVIQPDNGAQPRVVFADNGEVLRNVTTQMGEEAVAGFVQKSAAALERSAPPFEGSSITFDGSVQTDQWTVSAALNDHRPLLKYAVNDSEGTVLYVSSTTGEVVRDAHGTERMLNYFGAVTHWLYPTFVRKYPLLWEWIIDILSGVGVVLAITGLWIGWLRWNRRARPGKPQVPYKGLMRWHYFTGIICGSAGRFGMYASSHSPSAACCSRSSASSSAGADCGTSLGDDLRSALLSEGVTQQGAGEGFTDFAVRRVSIECG